MFSEYLKPELLQYGSTVVAIAAFTLIAFLIRELKKKNGDKSLEERLSNLENIENNHLHELKDIMNRVDRRTEQIINILTKIETKICQK